MPSIIVRRDEIAPSLWEVETSTGLVKYQSVAYARDTEEQKTFKGVGRAEAKRLHKLHQAEFENATPSSITDSEKTLGEARDLAWAHHQSLIDVEESSGDKAPVSQGTLDNYKGHWEKRITPYKVNGRSIDELKLKEFTKPVAREWLKYLRTSHGSLASGTRNAAVSALRNTLHYSRDSDYMEVDPFHDIPSAEFPAQKTRPGWKPVVFTEEQRDLVIEAAQSEAFIEATPDVLLTEAVIFLAVTGARLSEALGVRWGSVEMGDGDDLVRVFLREQRIRHKADEEAKTKLFMKNGEVAVRPTLSSPALSEAMRRQATHELSKDRGVNEHLVFTDVIGRPIRADQLKQGVQRACKLAGLGHHGPQVLRRTMATTLAQNAVGSADGSAIMGHSQATFENEYVKPIMNEKKLTSIEALVFKAA